MDGFHNLVDISGYTSIVSKRWINYLIFSAYEHVGEANLDDDLSLFVALNEIGEYMWLCILYVNEFRKENQVF